MIPRAVNQIFLAAASLKDKGWEYTMEASFLEIYNESIRDLLGNNDPSKKFDIKHGQTNNSTTVTDLTTSKLSLSFFLFLFFPKPNQTKSKKKNLFSDGANPREGVPPAQKGVRAQGCRGDAVQREVFQKPQVPNKKQQKT